jgi:hypothetical protein
VLAKSLKIEVRSDKRLGLDLGMKDLIFPWGYSQDLQDTIFRPNHYRILQGPFCKTVTLSSSSGPGAQEQQKGGRAAVVALLASARGVKGSIEM